MILPSMLIFRLATLGGLGSGGLSQPELGRALAR